MRSTGRGLSRRSPCCWSICIVSDVTVLLDSRQDFDGVSAATRHPGAGLNTLFTSLSHQTPRIAARCSVQMPHLGIRGKSSTVNRVSGPLAAAAIFRYQTDILAYSSPTNQTSSRRPCMGTSDILGCDLLGGS
jgi:hypothetical protein